MWQSKREISRSAKGSQISEKYWREVGKRKRADVYLEVRKKRGNIFFEWNKCLWRYPKIASNKPPHCIFFSHIYIFRSVKSVCNVRQWGFPICPQTFRREWRSSKRFLLPDFLAFSVVPRESNLLKTLYTVIFGIFNICWSPSILLSVVYLLRR